MTQGRKPRKPRAISANPFGVALRRATRLTETEIASAIAPARECLQKLKEGVATEHQHALLRSILMIAHAIEEGGVVRGLCEQIDASLQAMTDIGARSLESGQWRQAVLFPHELDAIQEMVDLHDYQLRQVSFGELQAVTRKLIAKTLSEGGETVHVSYEDMGLVPA